MKAKVAFFLREAEAGAVVLAGLTDSSDNPSAQASETVISVDETDAGQTVTDSDTTDTAAEAAAEVPSDETQTGTASDETQTGTAADETQPGTASDEIQTEIVSDEIQTETASAESQTETASAESQTETVIAESETETASAAGAAEDSVRMLSASGEDYEITLSYTADAQIPDGSTVKAEEITKHTSTYLKTAEKTLDLTTEDSQKVAGRFFDITIVDPSGNEIEPAAPVSVTVRCESDYAQALRSDPQVVHFEHGSKKKAEEVEVQDTASEETADTIAFTADSFSVYGVVYTVDFKLGEYAYSMAGESSIKLSTLMAELGVEELDVTNVAKVEFTDPSLVGVTKDTEDADWTLTSLQPFTSEENLTVTMGDGSFYTITVKDEQTTTDLTKLLTSVNLKIDGQTVSSDHWEVVKGKVYDMTLHFEEDSDGLQFAHDGNSLTYKLPDGIAVPADSQSGTFKMSFPSAGKVFDGNKYTINSDGTITITWKDDNELKELIGRADNCFINLNIKAYFNESKDSGKFSDTVEKSWDVTEQHNAKVAKVGTYNKDTGKIDYTITVTSEGTTQNIKVADTITGSALTLDQSSLQYETNGQTTSIPSDWNVSTTDKGFNLTIPSMTDGQEYKIKYSASVDFTKLGGNGNTTAAETGNGVKITPDTDDNPGDNEAKTYSHEINFSSIGKKSGQISATQEDSDGKKYKTVAWTITANKEHKVPLTFISDKIGTPDVMKYDTSTPLTVVVKDKNGNIVETRTVNWSDSSITHTDSSWKYSIPADDQSTDKCYSYEVSYNTIVSMNDSSDTTISNAASDDKGSVNIPGTIANSDKITATKTATKVTSDHIDWQISVNVPGTGLDSFVITDNLPSYYGNNKYLYDSLMKETLKVEGISPDEGYKYADITENITHYDQTVGGNVIDRVDYKGFTLTFNKGTNADGSKIPGLKATENGSSRTITVTFSTKNNEEWLKLVHDTNAVEGQNHTNKDNANNVSFEATGTVSEKAISKNSDQISYANLDESADGTLKKDNGGKGTDYPVYRYCIKLSGVTADQLTLEDTFDTSIFKLYTRADRDTQGFNGDYLDRQNCLYGGNAYDADWNNGKKEVESDITTTETGFKLNTSNLPKMTSGDFYPYYYFYYYLIVKDANALETLKNRAIHSEDGRTATLTNTINWDGATSKCDVDYTYKVVNKETSDGANGKQHYKITINSTKARLNNGAAMDLVDEYTNQNIDVSTLHIVSAVDKDGTDRKSEISYDIAGNTLTLMGIPDETAVVIEYDANVIGEAGSTVKLTNTATLQERWWDHTDKEKTVSSSAEGGGEVYQIKLFKYGKGHMEKGLNGAVFQLYDANKNEMTYPEGSKSGQKIQFTTGSDGYVTVTLSKSTDGIALQKDTLYYLKEVTPPANFEVDDTFYGFKISSDGTSRSETDSDGNISYRIYPINGTMTVQDKPITGHLVIEKSVEGYQNLTEDQKKSFVFTVTKVDESGNAITGDDAYSKTVTYDEFVTKDGYSHPVYDISGLEAGNYKVTETCTDSLFPNYTRTTTYKIGSSDAAPGIDGTITLTQDQVNSRQYGVISYTNSYAPDTTDFGFSKIWSEGSWGKGSDGNDITLTFTLTGSKEGETETKTYTITATSSGVSISPQDKDGKPSVDFGDDKTDSAYPIKVTGLPGGYTYSVAETVPEGYVSSTSEDGRTITNTKKGSLKFKKEVTVNGNEPTTDQDKTLRAGNYTFTITGPGNSTEVNKTVVVKVDKDGTVTTDTEGVTVTDEGYVKLDGLTAGTYTIAETATSNGTSISKINNTETTSASTTVTVVDGDTTAAQASAVFTNNINTGNLKLEKTVTGISEDDLDGKEFAFEVTLTAPNGVTFAEKYAAILTKADGTTESKEVSLETVNGVTKTKDIKLKSGESLEIQGLPEGTTYTVAETGDSSIEGYDLTTSYKVDNGELKAGATTESYTISKDVEKDISFTNAYTPKNSDFSFSKQWLVNKDASAASEWPAKVTSISLTLTGTKDSKKIVYDVTVNSSKWTATYNAEKSDIKILPAGATSQITGEVTKDSSNNYTVSMSGLPYGYTYTISETRVDGYDEPVYLNADGTKIENATAVGSTGKIQNVETQKYELPATGGIGTHLFRILGFAMVAIAAVAFVLIRCRSRDS